jgi:RNA polymerase sigma factor (sigma-70 family)
MREGLVLDNMPLVRRIAHRLARRYAPRVCVEDFVQDGYVGLCDAARRCKPDQVEKFPEYATFRIHGAILDGYRGRPYRENRHASYEGLCEEHPEAVAFLQAPDPAPLPDELAERAELESKTREAIAELPEDERYVIREAAHGIRLVDIARDCEWGKPWTRQVLVKARDKVVVSIRRKEAA